jgi:hypothetical protein
MGFSRPQLVVVSGLFFHDGILAMTKPFLRIFFLFFTMEFWLSRSLSHELFLFSRWNSGYHKAFFHELFSFFHDGILAITKPFLRTFFFFHDGILAITKPFLRTFFFFHDGILDITKPFLRTFFLFSRWNSRGTRFGGRLFSYIYHKEYLHRIRLVKNLAS